MLATCDRVPESRILEGQDGDLGGDDVAVKDPVCGMNIEESDAVGTSEYKGTTYYFCSSDCKETFDADPEDYAA